MKSQLTMCMHRIFSPIYNWCCFCFIVHGIALVWRWRMKIQQQPKMKQNSFDRTQVNSKCVCIPNEVAWNAASKSSSGLYAHIWFTLLWIDAADDDDDDDGEDFIFRTFNDMTLSLLLLLLFWLLCCSLVCVVFVLEHSNFGCDLILSFNSMELNRIK